MDATDRMIADEVRAHPWMLPLLRMLDLFDGGVTYAHVWRTARGVVLASASTPTDDAELRKRIRAALLHDIGKVLTSRETILKPATLSDEEWRDVRRHPRLGFEVVRTVDEPVALQLVLHHECAWRAPQERHRNYPRAAPRRNGADRRLVARTPRTDRRVRDRRAVRTTDVGAVLLALVDLVDALSDGDRPYLRGRVVRPSAIRAAIRERYDLLAGIGDHLVANHRTLHRPVPSVTTIATFPHHAP